MRTTVLHVTVVLAVIIVKNNCQLKLFALLWSPVKSANGWACIFASGVMKYQPWVV